MATTNSNITTFSVNLARIRKQRGYSQTDLAKISGISSRMIGYYEKNVTNIPLDKAEILAKALNVTVLELLGTSNSIDHDPLDDLKNADVRILKQLQKVLQLSKADRLTVYKIIDSLLNKKESKSKSPQ